MAMGEAAGTPPLALNAGVTARDIDVRACRNAARPGRRSRRPDRPNADVPALAAYVRQAETA